MGEIIFEVLSLFAFSKLQVTKDVSPGPYLPKQKEPSHRGDSGWDWFNYTKILLFHNRRINFRQNNHK
jgi:hypothetical protein